jgi:hypothetical protein
MLPLIGVLVQNTIANENDWRFKHAGIMAFSQVGEYIEDIEKLDVMIPVLVSHLSNGNPKVRHASAHAIGQLADDMPNDFQKRYNETVIPGLVLLMDDSVPRVAAHACAALTNFFEHATSEMVNPVADAILGKIHNLIQNGPTMVKENAVTCMATVAENIEKDFAKYF